MNSRSICAVLLAIFVCAKHAQPKTALLTVTVTDQTGAIINTAGIRGTSSSSGTLYDRAVDANGMAVFELPERAIV
jgi:hypothetical protein